MTVFISDLSVVHGTVDGYRAGCSGSTASCGAAVSCLDVFTRYSGDWGFRKRVDAGESPAVIVAEEAAEAEAVKARDRVAERAKMRPLAPKRSIVGKSKPSIVETWSSEVARLNGEGLTDTQIADALGLKPMQATYVRSRLGLTSAHHAKRGSGYVESLAHRRQTIRTMHADGRTDAEIGAALGLDRERVAVVRRYMKLSRNAAVEPERFVPPVGPRPEPRQTVPGKTLVDAGPAQRHIVALTDAGLSLAQIAVKANVPEPAVKRLVYPRGKGRGPASYVVEERAKAILAVALGETS